ncbi:distal membrane-arm assembly complex protein 2 [Anoplophora glabripennis]|uniref:distal membrane-arm assembly complex protein 2 n=1 Tax=Anoplophora glabripennis TaxID=217634 RepID=UPI000874166F|nr:distal membrane-arm assembly complex protein 2 [Anoplophora glabripennis]
MIKFKLPRNLPNSTFQHCKLCSSRNNFKDSPKSLQKSEDNELIPKKYDPKQISRNDMKWRTPWHQKEGQYYNFLRTFYKEDNNRSVLKTLQTPIDVSPSSIKNWWSSKTEERDIILQSYLPQRNQMLGNELAAAHFIVHRGGSVKFFNEEKWIKANEHNEYTLPKFYEEGKILEAIDCSDMNLMYEGLVNLRDLKNVVWLSLNGCEKMDDWCMDRISNIFSHSLVYLDLRNCPNITDRGIGALYKLMKLKILYLDDFLRSTTYEMTCLLLQEANPQLDIRSDPVVFET